MEYEEDISRETAGLDSKSLHCLKIALPFRVSFASISNGKVETYVPKVPSSAVFSKPSCVIPLSWTYAELSWTLLSQQASFGKETHWEGHREPANKGAGLSWGRKLKNIGGWVPQARSKGTKTYSEWQLGTRKPLERILPGLGIDESVSLEYIQFLKSVGPKGF